MCVTLRISEVGDSQAAKALAQDALAEAMQHQEVNEARFRGCVYDVGSLTEEANKLAHRAVEEGCYHESCSGLGLMDVWGRDWEEDIAPLVESDHLTPEGLQKLREIIAGEIPPLPQLRWNIQGQPAAREQLPEPPEVAEAWRWWRALMFVKRYILLYLIDKALAKGLPVKVLL